MLTLKLDDKQEATLMAALYAQKDYWIRAAWKAGFKNEIDLFNEQLIDTIKLIEFIEAEYEEES